MILNKDNGLFIGFKDEALAKCYSSGFEAAYMPQLVDTRLEGNFWDESITTPSIKSAGRTRQGAAVVVYAHIPNFLCIPRYIEMIRTGKIESVLDTAAFRFPQTEFQSLVDTDGLTDAQGNRLVWVVDYETLKKAPSSKLQIEDALTHPQTIPFLGGEQRAERYLAEYQRRRLEIGRKYYRTHEWSTKNDIRLALLVEKTIRITHRQIHDQDFDEDSPIVRLLLLGGIKNVYDDNNGLVGDENMYSSSTFLGYHQTNETDQKNRKVVASRVDQFLGRVNKIMFDTKRILEKRLIDLYKKTSP